MAASYPLRANTTDYRANCTEGFKSVVLLVFLRKGFLFLSLLSILPFPVPKSSSGAGNG